MSSSPRDHPSFAKRSNQRYSAGRSKIAFLYLWTWPALLELPSTSAAPAEIMIRSMSQKIMKSASSSSKEVWILRHGQATHNPRAEKAKAEGCSFEEFIELMRQDDSLDSPLTALGHQQAREIHQTYFSNPQISSRFDLIVSSPLSRALQTADGALPPSSSSQDPQQQHSSPRRICCEHWREINGQLMNAHRRSKSELQQRFPHWNFDHLQSDEDDTWKPEAIEPSQECRERGYLGFQWILEQPSHECILLVAHGGILRYTMQDFAEKVVVQDGRRGPAVAEEEGRSNEDDTHSTPVLPTRRTSCSRFGNCELRRYRIEWMDNDLDNTKSTDDSTSGTRRILLTELSIDDDRS